MIFDLDAYVKQNIMSLYQKHAIQAAVAKHKNILVIGGTGSGKTTLVNAIIHEMVQQNPNERLVIIEDTGEIQCNAKNYVQYHTSLDVSMTQLLKTTLRMRPDRIIVGEVRGGEALDLLDAWNTGHEGGAATLHANNALAGLSRLKSLITRNPAAPQAIELLIKDAVHLLLYIAKTDTGRKLTQMMEITGYENGQYRTHELTEGNDQ